MSATAVAFSVPELVMTAMYQLLPVRWPARWRGLHFEVCLDQNGVEKVTVSAKMSIL